MKTLSIIPILLIVLFSGCNNSESGKEGSEEKEVKEQNSESSSNPTKNSIINSQVAVDFLYAYIQNCNKLNEAIGVIEWVNTSPLVTESFKTELEKLVSESLKENPEMGLGFDPILNAQDYPEEGVEIKEFNEESGYVIVNGINWESFKVTVKLINDGGQTKVEGCGVVNIPKEKRAKEI